MLLSKLGESFSLASVSACYEQTASVRCERLQSDGHAPPFDSPETAAIAGNEYDD